MDRTVINGSELFILDVGHGNTAFLSSQGHTAIFDTALGTELLELLNSHSISEIEHVFISHADRDHVGGVLALLSNFSIRELYINADPRDTESFNDLRVAVNDAVKRNKLKQNSLQSSLGNIIVGDVTIEIIAPSAGLVMGGIGSIDHEHNNSIITANTLSGVLSLTFRERRVALFAGDMDESSFSRIQSEVSTLDANILIFPHHGGRGAGDLKEFARGIIDLVKPDITFFSIGRNQYGTPQPEIIDGIRSAEHKTRILCTQLSTNCSLVSPLPQFSNLSDLPSRGKLKKQTCGGSIHIKLDDLKLCYEWLLLHTSYIENNFPDALCLRR